MLLQTRLIDRVRHLCREDPRVVAAILYGSFTQGEGDRYSDVEFVFFFVDGHLPPDQRAWVEQIAPVALYFADDSGHQTAIFYNLIRGEFHFYPASQMAMAASWQGNAWFPSLASTLLIDHTGALTGYLAPLIGPPPRRDTPETVQSLIDNYLNWTLFGFNVLARGELARALELLNVIHRSLLKLVRLAEGSTGHWPTPSRSLEADISASAYERFRSCTAWLDRVALWRAYVAAWGWGQELMGELGRTHELVLPEELIERLADYFQELRSTTMKDQDL